MGQISDVLNIGKQITSLAEALPRAWLEIRKIQLTTLQVEAMHTARAYLMEISKFRFGPLRLEQVLISLSNRGDEGYRLDQLKILVEFQEETTNKLLSDQGRLAEIATVSPALSGSFISLLDAKLELLQWLKEQDSLTETQISEVRRIVLFIDSTASTAYEELRKILPRPQWE